jgi:hypothetical protein
MPHARVQRTSLYLCALFISNIISLILFYEVDPADIEPSFNNIFRKLQHGKVLEKMRTLFYGYKFDSMGD